MASFFSCAAMPRAVIRSPLRLMKMKPEVWSRDASHDNASSFSFCGIYIRLILPPLEQMSMYPAVTCSTFSCRSSLIRAPVAARKRMTKYQQRSAGLFNFRLKQAQSASLMTFSRNGFCWMRMSGIFNVGLPMHVAQAFMARSRMFTVFGLNLSIKNALQRRRFFFVNSPKCVVYCLAAKQYEATVLADLLAFRRNAENFSRSIIAVSFHQFCYDSETKRHRVTSVLVVAFSSSTRFTIRFCSFKGGSGMRNDVISPVVTPGELRPFICAFNPIMT